MIPLKIHYCWFGHKPLPESAKKCIASWKKYFPDYEIIEWNEDNFDVNAIPYTSEAYRIKKYAFVSDYARFFIIQNEGGIYFDTDVEVIKPFDDILRNGGFFGYETDNEINPGLGFASEKNNPIINQIIKYYNSLPGFTLGGLENNIKVDTVVQHTTRVLIKNGAKIGSNKLCSIKGLNIYPSEWFNPLESTTGRLRISDNTHSIHWYDNSWGNQSSFYTKLSKISHRIFGTKFPHLIKRIFFK